MKRALGLLAVIALTAGVTWLAARWQIAEERADRLSQALRDAEARANQLQGDIEAANERLAELRQKQEQAVYVPISHANSVTVKQSVSHSTSLQENKAALSVEERILPGPHTMATVPMVWGVYNAVTGPGMLLRIEGTSSLHDWRVESPLIGGYADFRSGFPVSGKGFQLGPIECSASIFVPVRSLKSVEPDGAPYSDKMNEVMHEALRAAEYPRIYFALKSLTATASFQKDPNMFLCDAAGDLAIAGQTNSISMTAFVSLKTDNSVVLSGSTRLRMSDFKLRIPEAGPARPGDEVTVSFRWSVTRKTRPEFAR
jgi:hypothetical protein